MSNDDLTVELENHALTIHIHNELSPTSELFNRRVLQILRRMELRLTDISASMDNFEQALSQMAFRVNEDVNNLQDLLTQALATQANDATEVARIRADAEAAVNRINEATRVVQNIDPDVNFPSPRPSEQEPPTTDTLAGNPEEERGTGPIRDTGQPVAGEPQGEANPS